MAKLYAKSQAKLHLMKMAAGISSLEELKNRQSRYAKKRKKNGASYLEVGHVTRMWPKRAEELLDGGCLYWVFAGGIRVRQRILDFQEYADEDGHRRCRIVLDSELTETDFLKKRAFQGWRYLAVGDAPPDIGKASTQGPSELRAQLKELGLL